MIGDRFPAAFSLPPFSEFFSPLFTLAVTMDWLRQPSASSSAPWPCISFSSTFPALSMKLTPQRFTWNFCLGEAADSSRQHCSRVLTHCPERRPSTLSMVLARFDSIVILSILVCWLLNCISTTTSKSYFNLLIYNSLFFNGMG